METPLKKPRVFYGYWIVAVAFLCMFIYSGAGYYAFSLFYGPLQKAFGWDRGTISIAFTIYFVVQALASPFIGRVVDRYGTKKLIVLGSILCGLGFVWLTFMGGLYSFYGSYIVMGIGSTAMGPIPVTRVVSTWFVKRRGLAVGIMSTGIGAGALVLAPLVGAYLIPVFDWRPSYFVLAVLFWVLIIPITLFLIKEKPSDIGLYPDGAAGPEPEIKVAASLKPSEKWTLSIALKTSAFWLIALAFFFTNGSHTATLMHQVNYLTDIGFPVTTAAIALGAVGFASAVGKFFFGWLCDKIEARYAAAICYGLQLAGIFVLFLLKPTSPVIMLWLYALLIGLGIGGWLPTMSMVTSSSFGLAAYGAIFGGITFAQSMGDAFGPLVVGQMYDAMHTYFWAFIVLMALFVIAIPAILATRRPKFPA